MDQQVLNELHQKIQKVLDVLKTDISTIRTGKASPALVENVVLRAYGGSVQLKVMELATIGASDPHTLVITPFDHTVIQEIEKGIREANIGLSPVVDGQIIRISIPPLSEERRQELIKSMRHKLENGRIMVRQVRHEEMSVIKKAHDDKTISDDDMHRMEKEVQKIVDETMQTIDGMGEQKEKELLQI
ncbi:MAG: ribosome recycling factor [Candidatus Levybacteria bacterium]|nr:ribosome recycling factor [Candidatus Levybacteria bacterium]